MAWPSTSGMPQPSVDSLLVAGATITTSLTAVPNWTAATLCWLLGVWVTNHTNIDITLSLADSADAIFAQFIVPVGYDGPPSTIPGFIPFKPQTGLKWKVSNAGAGFSAQVWGYQ